MCIDRAPISAPFRLVALALGLATATLPALTSAADAVPVGADAVRAGASRAAPSPLLAIDQNRGTVVDRIVADWSDALVAANVGLSRDQLRTMLAAMRADHLLAASLAGSLDGLRNVIAQAITSSAPAATDLFESKSLGDTGGDLVYTPVTPCRLVDTRGSFAAVYQGDGTAAHTPSPFATNQIRSYTEQGGNGVCLSQLPAGLNPSAVQMQVFGIPVSAAASGDIEVLPQGSTFGSTATLVYLGSIPFTAASTTARVNLANNQIGVQVRGGGAHVVIDVLGYFKAPGAPIGTVSNIATGTGLTGGPITTTGTISIAAGGVGATQLASKAVTQAKLSPVATPTPGQVLGSDGTNLQWQTVSGGGGGVSGVTASAPLASSGGSTPNVSLTGTVPVANGGTGRTTLANNGVIIGQGAGAVATAVGTTGQVLMGTAGAPAWTSAPVFGGNLAVAGTTLLSPNVGIGTNTPASIVHILQPSNPVAPRVESWGSTGFAGGWDFYRTGTPKGYVGVPDPSAAIGAGEMILYGAAGTATSLWGGQARALTVSASGSGNVGIGTAPASTTKLTVAGASYGMLADATSFGVYAAASNGTGVFGSSTVASLTQAGVYGYNVGNGGIGVIGEANSGSATGVFGVSGSPNGFGIYARNQGGGRALFVDGPAAQGQPFGGLAKALVYVTAQGAIVRCFNGITGSSTVPCGFSVSHPVIGNYTINFGFSVIDRYAVLQPVEPGVPGALAYIFDYPTNNVMTVGVLDGAGNFIPWNAAFYALIF